MNDKIVWDRKEWDVFFKFLSKCIKDTKFFGIKDFTVIMGEAQDEAIFAEKLDASRRKDLLSIRHSPIWFERCKKDKIPKTMGEYNRFHAKGNRDLFPTNSGTNMNNQEVAETAASTKKNRAAPIHWSEEEKFRVAREYKRVLHLNPAHKRNEVLTVAIANVLPEARRRAADSAFTTLNNEKIFEKLAALEKPSTNEKPVSQGTPISIGISRSVPEEPKQANGVDPKPDSASRMMREIVTQVLEAKMPKLMKKAIKKSKPKKSKDLLRMIRKLERRLDRRLIEVEEELGIEAKKLRHKKPDNWEL